MSTTLLIIGLVVIVGYIALGIIGLFFKNKANRVYKETLKKSLSGVNGQGAELANSIDVLKYAPFIEQIVESEKLIQALKQKLPKKQQNKKVRQEQKSEPV